MKNTAEKIQDIEKLILDITEGDLLTYVRELRRDFKSIEYGLDVVENKITKVYKIIDLRSVIEKDSNLLLCQKDEK